MLYRHVIFVILFFIVQGLLSACGPVTIKDETKQAFVPIQGWMLELHQDVFIPSQRTRVFFQTGRLLSGINELEPHCQLRVDDISDQPQAVHAGLFTIDKVFGTLDQIVYGERIHLASVGDTVIAGGNGDGNGESRQMYFYFMELNAEKQPNVTYLVCGGALDDPAFAEYPTLEEIRAALGDYATLLLPD